MKRYDFFRVNCHASSKAARWDCRVGITQLSSVECAVSSAVLVCNLERNEGGGQIQMKNISMGVDPGDRSPEKNVVKGTLMSMLSPKLLLVMCICDIML